MLNLRRLKFTAICILLVACLLQKSLPLFLRRLSPLCLLVPACQLIPALLNSNTCRVVGLFDLGFVGKRALRRLER